VPYILVVLLLLPKTLFDDKRKRPCKLLNINESNGTILFREKTITNVVTAKSIMTNVTIISTQLL
jgi:hypothetical protein